MRDCTWVRFRGTRVQFDELEYRRACDARFYYKNVVSITKRQSTGASASRDSHTKYCHIFGTRSCSGALYEWAMVGFSTRKSVQRSSVACPAKFRLKCLRNWAALTVARHATAQRIDPFISARPWWCQRTRKSAWCLAPHHDKSHDVSILWITYKNDFGSIISYIDYSSDIEIQ